MIASSLRFLDVTDDHDADRPVAQARSDVHVSSPNEMRRPCVSAFSRDDYSGFEDDRESGERRPSIHDLPLASHTAGRARSTGGSDPVEPPADGFTSQDQEESLLPDVPIADELGNRAVKEPSACQAAAQCGMCASSPNSGLWHPPDPGDWIGELPSSEGVRGKVRVSPRTLEWRAREPEHHFDFSQLAALGLPVASDVGLRHASDAGHRVWLSGTRARVELWRTPDVYVSGGRGFGAARGPLKPETEAQLVERLAERFISMGKGTSERRERAAYKEMLVQVSATALETQDAEKAAMLLSQRLLVPVSSTEALRSFRRSLRSVLCDDRVLDMVEDDMSEHFARFAKDAVTSSVFHFPS